jgi:Na+/H+ antiporter NhaD/arsenite permease-like protein
MDKRKAWFSIGSVPGLLLPGTALASEGTKLSETGSIVGLVAVAIFVLAYAFVVLEEQLHLRKSKPVMLAAGAVWALIAWTATASPTLTAEFAANAFRHAFLEFAELFFFLIVAMSYVAAISERNVFEALRAWLVSRGFSFRQLFWLTGTLAFFLSPILDNLTTALIMSGVVLAVGAGNARFIALA